MTAASLSLYMYRAAPLAKVGTGKVWPRLIRSYLLSLTLATFLLVVLLILVLIISLLVLLNCCPLFRRLINVCLPLRLLPLRVTVKMLPVNAIYLLVWRRVSLIKLVFRRMVLMNLVNIWLQFRVKYRLMYRNTVTICILVLYRLTLLTFVRRLRCLVVRLTARKLMTHLMVHVSYVFCARSNRLLTRVLVRIVALVPNVPRMFMCRVWLACNRVRVLSWR